MRIEICHTSNKTECINTGKIRSGIVNCAAAFSDKFWKIEDLYSEKVDVVIMNGGGVDMEKLKSLGGKPKNWGKLLFLQCIPYYLLNDIKILRKIKETNIDGFLVWDTKSIHQFKIFGKPVEVVYIPYGLNQYKKYQDIPKKGKMIINIKNLNDNFIGLPTLIKIIQETQNDIDIYATVNPAYRQYMSQLLEICKMFKLKINLFEPIAHFSYMDDISDFKIFLSADERLNAERFIIDAALMGSISISPFNYVQEELFPDYIYNKYFIETAIDWIKNWRKLETPKPDLNVLSHVYFKNTVLDFIKRI